MLVMSVQSQKIKKAGERYQGLPNLVSLSFSDQVCHDVALATEDAVRGREGEVCARQVC